MSWQPAGSASAPGHHSAIGWSPLSARGTPRHPARNAAGPPAHALGHAVGTASAPGQLLHACLICPSGRPGRMQHGGHTIPVECLETPCESLILLVLCLLKNTKDFPGHVAGMSTSPWTGRGSPGGAATGTAAASVASVMIRGVDATAARPSRHGTSQKDPLRSPPSLRPGTVAKTYWRCPAQPRPRPAAR